MCFESNVTYSDVLSCAASVNNKTIQSAEIEMQQQQKKKLRAGHFFQHFFSKN